MKSELITELITKYVSTGGINYLTLPLYTDGRRAEPESH